VETEEFEQDAPQTPEAAEPTGHPVVDSVISSLEDLDHTPVPDQVPVFEAAHEKLRAALADAGNENPSA